MSRSRIVFLLALGSILLTRSDAAPSRVPPPQPKASLDRQVASYKPIRDIDGQLYDLSDAVRWRMAPYYVNGTVFDRVADGSFVAITVDRPGLPRKFIKEMAIEFSRTRSFTIYDAIALARTERVNEQLFVVGLPDPGTNSSSVSFVAVPFGVHPIVRSGRTNFYPKLVYGKPVESTVGYSNIFRVTRAGLIRQSVIQKSQRDDPRIVEFQNRRAEEGSEEAQYLMAVRYLNGNGVEPNRELALKWLRKSAEQGYQPARKLLLETTGGN